MSCIITALHLNETQFVFKISNQGYDFNIALALNAITLDGIDI